MDSPKDIRLYLSKVSDKFDLVAHSNQSELTLHLFHLFGTTKAAL